MTIPFRNPHGRTDETISILARRDAALREAADQYCPGWTDHAAARHLHHALTVFAAGPWRRERLSPTLPSRYAGKIGAQLWQILKIRPAIPSIRSIRRALADRQTRGRSPWRV